jgi:hypothetical protein
MIAGHPVIGMSVGSAENMLCGIYPLLCDVIADLENTDSSTVECWNMVTELSWQCIDQICYSMYLIFCTYHRDTQCHTTFLLNSYDKVIQTTVRSFSLMILYCWESDSYNFVLHISPKKSSKWKVISFCLPTSISKSKVSLTYQNTMKLLHN